MEASSSDPGQNGDALPREKEKKKPKLTYSPPPLELPLFQSLFRAADTTDNGNVITHDEAFEILALSTVPHHKLKMILSMISNDKLLLNKDQFYVAVRLVQFTQNQQSVMNLNLTVPASINLNPPYFQGINEIDTNKFALVKYDPQNESNECKVNDDQRCETNSKCTCASLSLRCVLIEKEMEKLRQILEVTVDQVHELTEELTHLQQKSSQPEKKAIKTAEASGVTNNPNFHVNLSHRPSNYYPKKLPGHHKVQRRQVFIKSNSFPNLNGREFFPGQNRTKATNDQISFTDKINEINDKSNLQSERKAPILERTISQSVIDISSSSLDRSEKYEGNLNEMRGKDEFGARNRDIFRKAISNPSLESNKSSFHSKRHDSDADKTSIPTMKLEDHRKSLLKSESFPSANLYKDQVNSNTTYNNARTKSFPRRPVLEKFFSRKMDAPLKFSSFSNLSKHEASNISRKKNWNVNGSTFSRIRSESSLNKMQKNFLVTDNVATFSYHEGGERGIRKLRKILLRRSLSLPIISKWKRQSAPNQPEDKRKQTNAEKLRNEAFTDKMGRNSSAIQNASSESTVSQPVKFTRYDKNFMMSHRSVRSVPF